MKQCSVVTQFGTLTLTEETGAITRLSWGHVDAGATSDLLDRAADQLRAFDAGRLTQFDVPLQVAGSDVLRAVCAEISAIPFGETCTCQKAWHPCTGGGAGLWAEPDSRDHSVSPCDGGQGADRIFRRRGN